MSFIVSQSIGGVFIDAIINENAQSDLEITEIPVEAGADITDHAFVKPKKISLDCATYNAAATYNALVALQESRVPFTFMSGLYVYSDMLVKSLNPERDQRNANILRVKCDLQQVIIVSTASTPAGTSKNAGKPGGKKSRTAATPSKKLSSNTVMQNKTGGVVNTGSSAVSPAHIAARTPLQVVLGAGG